MHKICRLGLHLRIKSVILIKDIDNFKHTHIDLLYMSKHDKGDIMRIHIFPLIVILTISQLDTMLACVGKDAMQGVIYSK